MSIVFTKKHKSVILYKQKPSVKHIINLKGDDSLKNILVVGSINIDLTIHSDRFPKTGETVMGHSFAASPGGKGANQAIAVGKLGGIVKMLGNVGDDAYGQVLIDNFNKNGVIFCGQKLKDTPTGTAVITVSGGNNTIIIDSGANGCVTEKTIDDNRELFEWADIVIFQLEIPVASVCRGIKLAKECGCFVILNPAPYIDLPKEIFAFTDMVIPNETECQLMTGILPEDNGSTLMALEKMQAMGIKKPLITLGDKGSAFIKDGSLVICPARKVTAVDTTAAGDCFIGAMSLMLANGASLEGAVATATVASSIAVSRKGASDSIPTAEELGEML